MDTVLITGGAGFIGSHIAEYFQGRARVRVLDNFRSGRRGNLAGLDVELVEGSITDGDVVQEAIRGVDYVFHLAAMISVPESMQDPQECVRINTLGLLNILNASRDAGVRKLCFSSSCAVYGNDPRVPKDETMAPSPASPYAMTKLDGEYYCGLFQDRGWLQTVCLRYFNVFGPRQDPASAYAAAIPIFIDRAVRNDPITIFGDGEQTRDFVFVQDVAAANVHFATRTDAQGVFNIGCGQAVTVNALARRIVDELGSCSEIRHAPERAGDVRHSRASIALAQKAAFSPTWPFEDGLSKTIQWYRGEKTNARCNA
jgi:UDP-glucose 4-epimerase